MLKIMAIDKNHKQTSFPTKTMARQVKNRIDLWEYI